jgi:hypothetical protein
VPLNKTKYIFKGGDEIQHIEKYLDHYGGYRLSTVKTYVYHMGNSLETWVLNLKQEPLKKVWNTVIKSQKSYSRPMQYFFRSILFKYLYKLKFVKN